MIQELYQAVAPGIPIAALVISLVSLLVSMRNRSEQRAALLLGKRTEVVTKLAQRQSKLGDLALIYAQKLYFLQSNVGPGAELPERERISNNLKLVLEEQKNCEDLLERLRRTVPQDLAAFEDLLATANQFLIHVTGELEKEQVVFKELKDSLVCKDSLRQ